MPAGTQCGVSHRGKDNEQRRSKAKDKSKKNAAKEERRSPWSNSVAKDSEPDAARDKPQDKFGCQDGDPPVQTAPVASTLASASAQKPRNLAPFATRTKALHHTKRPTPIGQRYLRSPAIKDIPSRLSQVPRQLVPFADTAQHVPHAKRAKTGETSYVPKAVARPEAPTHGMHHHTSGLLHS
ncbi:hypothetical protein HII31_02816 [Pseudocercospora fuligena]|uniref:Uncharacterized protein n=1 Tax=Pseudocercospora fuligena TaxID=685502 RepID=A0A8H6RRC7_9PEZI|nr:hypothetical protein HII31_02816 [Pseudocercospora fuligena]